jgi:tetratricopeptide (TPR) repeat protein
LGGQGATNVGNAQPIQGTNTPNPVGNIPSISNVVILDANAPVLSVQRMTNDTLTIPWLQRLEDVDPANAYAQYLTGRIEYDLHYYDACKAQMYKVIGSSVDPDIQSSAYTYIALSDAQQGDYTSSRRFLKIAIDYDPAFRNNTAREELSGLR